MGRSGQNRPAVRPDYRALATVVGTMAFDADSDLKAPAFVFFEWRDGKHAPI